MINKPLIKANPHLRVPGKYRKALIANVASSTAIETGTSIEAIVHLLTAPPKPATAKKSRGSAR